MKALQTGREPGEQVLAAAAALFAVRGFHGMTLTELAEVLGGRDVDALTETFGDKERLFYAAIEYVQRPASDEPVRSAMRLLLPKVEKARLNSKLKTFHGEAAARLRALDSPETKPG
jgi:AcrR family transcriptional regulator